ncbi:uncharacterized protein LOC122249012 [Penaeus japonicus]|uniref:uncharacterized protein LOC122249012 n=1 Tax=Penaeus japonicus TaxID=27405 RepID=UPI001C70DC3B|nr:uncharacterized protein LOC122249012 [Penaeus japonicus]XP_042865430.1 uncharacterized protein LOC122249012 [Penaeus japonicus]XP_042865431.1 uncharacterized protein LOC122249012 [Penaeus japonicus]
MYPRPPPPYPMQWAAGRREGPPAEVPCQRGSPGAPSAFGQERQCPRASHGFHMQAPRGNQMPSQAPNRWVPIDLQNSTAPARASVPQESTEDSSVQYLGCVQRQFHHAPQPVRAAVQPNRGNNIQAEINQFMTVMQQHRQHKEHERQMWHQTQTVQPTYSQNFSKPNGMERNVLQGQRRWDSECYPQHNSQTSENVQYNTILNAGEVPFSPPNNYTVIPIAVNTRENPHDVSGLVPDLHTTQETEIHSEPSTCPSQSPALGDPTVSSTIKSPVSIQHEESPTNNEKSDITENAVDTPSAPDNTPKANLISLPKRMFSRKGKCLSRLLRKTPQGFPHISIDYEIYCYLCSSTAAGNNVYEHMFFGNLKCIECGHIVRSCKDFEIIRHSNVECGISKRKHRFASWADCPVEFLVYSLKKSLIAKREDECVSPSTEDVAAELKEYTKKLSLLRFYKPWKSGFGRCYDYIKSVFASHVSTPTSQESPREEIQQDVINREEIQQDVIKREEIQQDVINNVLSGDNQEEINMNEGLSCRLGTIMNDINRKEGNTDLEDKQEIKREEGNSVLEGSKEDMERREMNNVLFMDTNEEVWQETSGDTGGTSFLDIISQNERDEEHQVEGISIDEALEQYTSYSGPSTNDTSTNDFNQESRDDPSNHQVFKSVFQDSGESAVSPHDRNTPKVSSDRFITSCDDGETDPHVPSTDIQHHTTWGSAGDDENFAGNIKETETPDGFHNDNVSSYTSENIPHSEASLKPPTDDLTPGQDSEDYHVKYYYPSELPPEECPMCYYTLCATMFTLNTTNLIVSTECPDCSLKISIVPDGSANSSKRKKTKV